MRRDLDYRVVVRRVAVGSAPFRWEVRNGDALVPLRVSEVRYRGMEAAFQAGQIWLATLAGLATFPPGRTAPRSLAENADFKSGGLPIASDEFVEDEDDALELDDDGATDDWHPDECDRLGMTSDGSPGDGKN